MGWNVAEAGRFLRVQTFGFTAEQLRLALADGPERTLERLAARPPGYGAFEEEIAALTNREAGAPEKEQLMLYRAIHSPWPRREKEALFGRFDDRARVKTPIEFALNLSIAFGVRPVPAELRQDLMVLGQRFQDPGRARRWLNPFTRVARGKLAARILSRVSRFPDRAALLELMVQRDLPLRSEGRELAIAIASSEEFQWI